ncbi:hypothetical protein ElyMa_003357000 [Elysia marginata]|uniref:Uncharacterized protein n=1 Tax=Elysia marginata TaxID=1093978 RepID=A0AAV4JKX3_9GAST|nr:hypothetical protein ElyMa_003357000 [Elysia marginata]
MCVNSISHGLNTDLPNTRLELRESQVSHTRPIVNKYYITYTYAERSGGGGVSNWTVFSPETLNKIVRQQGKGCKRSAHGPYPAQHRKKWSNYDAVEKKNTVWSYWQL